MAVEIKDVVRRGYGANGSIAAVTTRGYTASQAVAVAASPPAGAILLLILFKELQPR